MGLYYDAELGQYTERQGPNHHPIRGRTQDEVGRHDRLDIVEYVKQNQ